MRLLYRVLPIIVAISVLAGETSTPIKKESIAVMTLKPIGIRISDAETLTDRLRAELVQTNQFIVLEREEMSLVFKEQGFQMSGVVDETKELVEVGKMLGAEKIVGGSISRIGHTYSVAVKMIDVETGEIVKSAVEDCRTERVDVVLILMENIAREIAGEVVERRRPTFEKPVFKPLKKISEGNTLENIGDKVSIFSDLLVEYRKIMQQYNENAGCLGMRIPFLDFAKGKRNKRLDALVEEYNKRIEEQENNRK